MAKYLMVGGMSAAARLSGYPEVYNISGGYLSFAHFAGTGLTL
jgi:hypothetical protein